MIKQHLGIRILNACIAVFCSAAHAYGALLFASEAMVNEPVKTGAQRVLTLDIGLERACVVSVFLVIGALLGWPERINICCVGVIVLLWLVVVWLL